MHPIQSYRRHTHAKMLRQLFVGLQRVLAEQFSQLALSFNFAYPQR